ncbi:peptidase M24, structural domain-containing protein [Globomyces pollinis-pini]|nr:peptidase M24, structural domain-containing protein [Globomyces pollinis-pini]
MKTISTKSNGFYPKLKVMSQLFTITCLLTVGWLLLNTQDLSISIKPDVPLDPQCPLIVPSNSPVPENRKRLHSLLSEDHQLIILPSSPRVTRLGGDMELPGWRQSSNIMYVLGEYSISDSYILINRTETSLAITILLPAQSQKEIVFSGAVPDLSSIKQKYAVESVDYITNLSNFINDHSTILSPEKGIEKLLSDQLKQSLKSKSSSVKFSEEVNELFIESRFIKSKAELEYLTYASQVAAISHLFINESIHKLDFVSESKLASLFEYVSTICQCRLQAYNPIVGAGSHGAVLHFPTGETDDGGNSNIGLKDLILIDAAGAFKGYASDLTRTYSRIDSERKRVLSKIVLDGQSEGIKAHKVGNNWSDVVDATNEKLLEGLISNNFFTTQDLKTLIDSGVISIFTPHGIGHPVGLDVHDPVPATFKTANVTFMGLRDQYPLKLSFDYTIDIGQVHTVEPGIYFVPYLLDLAKNDESLAVAHLINWDTIDQYRGIGGVRIEDVVAINYEGKSVILTKIFSSK